MSRPLCLYQLLGGNSSKLVTLINPFNLSLINVVINLLLGVIVNGQLTYQHIFEVWGETRASEGKPHSYEESVLTP